MGEQKYMRASLKEDGGSDTRQAKNKPDKLTVIKTLDKYDADIEKNPSSLGSYEGDESFDKLLAESDKRTFNSGEIVKGKVVDIQDDFVLVDINYKSEGLVPIGEFKNSKGTNVNIGDDVEVYIERKENENGMVIVSKDKADIFKSWNDMSKVAQNSGVVEGMVLARVKGGLSVDIGVKAFLPGSQIDLRPVRNLEAYIGKKFKFKVIKFNEKRGNIVVSRRALLEEDRESLKTNTLDSIKSGESIKGIVKNITDYGAFIDLGGMDGLLHITDISWKRVKHPSEVLKIGDQIDVKVLKYNENTGRVSLGLKQLEPDPWVEVISSFKIGDKAKGKVVSITDYGAFVELKNGVEGLIHVSEMSWTKRIKHPSEHVSIGEEVEVVVLATDTENRRISLGMKQLGDNPWEKLSKAYEVGSIIEGEIKSITDFGIFVGVEDGVDGLVHISDLSWTKKIRHPSELYKKGDVIRAVVLSVNVQEERFSLGVKQLEEDPWSYVDTKFAAGTVHDVEAVKITDFGVFVKLDKNIEGLIHISELSTERVDKASDVVNVGDTIKAEVVTLDKEARKIVLSARSVNLRDDQEKNASFGDLFADKLQQATDVKKTDAPKNKEDVQPEDDDSSKDNSEDKSK